jgi:serine/threonine protein kinase/Tol biopolymer transport system component/tetratricopeptide (TPR) repeat protein
MRPERWKLVEQLLEAALEQPPAARPAFLSAASQGDEELRREVESLLQADAQAGSFIAEPLLASLPTVAHDTVAVTDDPDLPTLLGKRLGAYKIERELGRGGMGAVYLAVRADNVFQKRVAVKIVKRGMDTDFILRRFRRERQILATLNHPNIAALLDGGSTNDGLPYFVMEHVEGQPINRFCDERKLSIAERLRLVQQVCAAVAYAHQKQIIHRDLKPGNILVMPSGNGEAGTVKLLDFGIAKLLGPQLAADTIGETATAVRLMTPEYASPEQVRGLPVTPASDVYSLGVLLYELLTGRRPYRLQSYAPHEMARVICEEEPVPPSEVISTAGRVHYAEERASTPEHLRSELEGNLDNIVLKALQKDARHRYATAADLAHDIARHLAGEHISVPYLFTPLALAPELIDETPTARSIAVLPMKVASATPREDTTTSFLGVGIADVLTTQLSQIRGLVVRPTSAVLRCCSNDDPFAIGKELGVDYLLDGRVQLAGEQMRVTMQLTSLRDQAVLWASQFNERVTDLLSVQDSIAAQVAEAIVPKLTGEDRARVVKRGTDDLQAYEAFLRARYYWHSYTMDSLAKALLHFNEAISIDPAFAAPYAGIAEYYNRLATFGLIPSDECFAAAKDAALKAVRLDESLAEAWGALAFATLGADWDRNESMRLIHRALELNPHSAQVLEWYAQILATSGRLREANTVIERVLKLDPGSAAIYVQQSFYQYLMRRPEGSLKATEQALRLDPNTFWALFGKATGLARSHQFDAAEATARLLLEVSDNNPLAKATLAFTHIKAGRRDEAQALLNELQETARRNYLSPFWMAWIQDELGARDEALKSVEQGIAQRDWWLLYFPYDPIFDELRQDARCQALLQKAGLMEAKPPLSNDAPTAIETASRAIEPKKSKRWWVAGASVLALAIAAFVWSDFFRFNFSYNSTNLPVFQTMTTTKLTSSGNAVVATISPDGKYLAYVTEEGERQTLWLRQVSVSNSVRLVAAADVEYRGLTFMPDGSFVRYVAVNKGDGKSALYEVSLLGGPARQVKHDVDSAISIAPDGRHFAFVRQHNDEGEDHLFIANLDGSNERELATRKFPDHFSINAPPAWSPDGQRVAVVVQTADANGFFMKAVTFNVTDNKETPLTTQRWMQIEQMNWLAGDHLLMTAQDAESPFLQLWSVSAASMAGKARRLTNDMSDYHGLSMSANGRSIVTVQRQTLINIWLAPKATPDRPTQLTTGAGRYFDLAWTRDGHILYASDASGSADIWQRHATSGEQTQLTAGASRNYGPAAAFDGRFVVFHSNRSGNWQIWRMNRDGSDQIALTSGHEESNWATVTPDGKWIVYEHFGAGTLTTLWKRPLDGGEPERLTKTLSMRPAISPDGQWIACWTKAETPNAPWQISLLSWPDGQVVKQFDVQQTDASGGSAIRWMPDSKSVVYIDFRPDLTSLWQQAISGGAPKKLLESAQQVIYSFDISRDGSIAFSRGLRAHDVVLLTDVGKP